MSYEESIDKAAHCLLDECEIDSTGLGYVWDDIMRRMYQIESEREAAK